MSTKANPGTGYYLPAEQLVKALPADLQEAYLDLVEAGDESALETWLSERWPKNLPPVSDVFSPGEEDDISTTSMEVGQLYAVFDTAALFLRTPTPELRQLRALGVADPEEGIWTVWG